MALPPQYHQKEVVTGSATYEGETKNGLKHGLGTLTWDDGEQFIGEFENDEKVRGTFTWKGGDVYTGEWKNSLMHGRGTYTYKNRRKYEGEWVGGYKEGQGIFTWPNGDKYEGAFHKDLCHGIGTQTYADGRVYKGYWQQNKKHGFGVMKSSRGEKTQGQWQNNVPNGIAIFTEANGKRYEERWKNGNREGQRLPLKRTDEDMKLQLKSVTAPVWVPDNDYKACHKCDAPFSVVNRRHHCRHCGLVFCNNCTTRKLGLPHIGFPEEVRVCDECFIALSTQEFSDQV